MDSLKQGSKYWYKWFITECPVCGRGDSWRERQYIQRPVDLEKRYEYVQEYDYCDM